MATVFAGDAMVTAAISADSEIEFEWCRAVEVEGEPVLTTTNCLIVLH
jgi:hypothetical protein